MTVSRSQRVGYSLVAAAACAWGTWPLFLRRAEGAGPVPPSLESAIAMAVMTVASAPLCCFDRVKRRATLGQWAGVAWLGVADAMNVICVFAAYQKTSVAIAVLTHYLTPLFVALFAPLALRERPSRRVFLSIGLSFVGLGLLLAPHEAGRRASDAIGALLGAASAVFYASNVLVNKRIVSAFSAPEIMFFHGVVATPILFLLVPHGAFPSMTHETLVVLLAGSISAGALGGLLFIWGLARVDAARASNLTFLEPLVAVVTAWAVLGEPLTLGRAAGGVLILGGAALAILDSRSDE